MSDNDYKHIHVVCENQDEKDLIQEKARKHGFNSDSAFMKFCAMNARIDISIGKYPLTANLMMLKDLYKEKIITKEEFEKIKNDIIYDYDSKELMIAKKKRG